MAQPNIPPELLAEILRMAGGTVGGYFLGNGAGGNVGGDAGYSIDPQMDTIYRPDKAGTSTMRNAWDAWGKDGTYKGHGTADSDLASGLKFGAMALGGYGIANGLAGAGLGGIGDAAGAGLGDAAAAGGADAATSAAWSSGAGLGGDTLTAMGVNGLGPGFSTMAGGGAAAAGGAGGGAGSGIGAAVKTALGANGGLAAGLLGGLAGAVDSGDKSATSSRDPWAPMQPYLLGLAKDGADLYQKYRQQPFSPAQQTAYGNVGGLLDALNQSAPALLAAMQQTAGGDHQFVRGQQNRIPTYAGPGFNFQPGAFGNFGTKG